MAEQPNLPYLSNEDRLKAYNYVILGCQHFWTRKKIGVDSKGRPLWSKQLLDLPKVIPILKDLIKLGYNDPYFLVKLATWSVK